MAAITDEQRRQVLELHQQGLGRNTIAAQLGIAAGSVSKIAQDGGVTFDRTATAAATEARKADARDRRAELELGYLEEAHRLLAELRKPVTVYNFGGKDNTYEERDHPEPDAAAKLKLMQASGVAVEKALRLADADGDANVSSARSMLGSLASALKVAADQLPGPAADA